MFPFFGLILLGFIASKTRLIKKTAVEGINNFVFYFALPALIFSKISVAPVGEIFNWNYILAYLLAATAVFVVTYQLGRKIFKSRHGEAAQLGLTGVYSNIGFMGIPVLLAVLGNEVAIPLTLAFALDLVVIVPIILVLIDAGQNESPGQRHFIRIVVRVTRNPLVLAIFTSIGFSAVGWTVPKPLGDLIGLLQTTAGPCALFALGAALAAQHFSKSMHLAGFMCGVKLVVHPLVVWTLLSAFGLPPLWITAGTLVVAMPIAVVAFVFSQQYDVYAEATSAAILISTIISVISVPLLLHLLI